MEADARHDRRLDLDRRGHEAAGFEASEGVLSATYLKDASDPQWKDDAGMKKVLAFATNTCRRQPLRHQSGLWLRRAQTMVQVLKSNPGRSDPGNVMKQAAA